MSFQIYLQCFDRGKPAGLPLAAIRALFPVVEAESEDEYWSVRYDESNECHVSVSPLETAPSLVAGLVVERPSQDLRLFEALLAILRQGSVVLYWPGDGAPLVADAGAAAQLPPGLSEDLGLPRVVTSAQEIVEAIREG